MVQLSISSHVAVKGWKIFQEALPGPCQLNRSCVNLCRLMSAAKEWVPSLCSKSRSSYVVAATVMPTRWSMPLGAEMKHAMLLFRRNVWNLRGSDLLAPLGKGLIVFNVSLKQDIFLHEGFLYNHSRSLVPPCQAHPPQSQHLGQNQPSVSLRRHLPKRNQCARYCIIPPESTKQVGKKLQGANSEA